MQPTQYATKKIVVVDDFLVFPFTLLAMSAEQLLSKQVTAFAIQVDTTMPQDLEAGSVASSMAPRRGMQHRKRAVHVRLYLLLTRRGIKAPNQVVRMLRPPPGSPTSIVVYLS